MGRAGERLKFARNDDIAELSYSCVEGRGQLETHKGRHFVKKRIFLAGVLSLAASASVQAAVVTYTLNLHESPTGQITAANQFAIWASVSQGDNAGLFAYGVDLKGTGDPGGPTGLTLTNRTPTGTWDADPNDPNFDPGAVYSTKYAGFGTGRGASGVTGVVSGVQDLAKDADLIRLYGFGQPPAHRMDDFRPPPDTSSGLPVAYAAYVGASNTDGGGNGGMNPYGNPPATCGVPAMPAGSARIATGTWTGSILPSIEQLSVNTKASVWKLNHPNGNENEIATLQFAFRDIVPAAGDTMVVTANVSGGGCGPTPTNQAVGGAIAVAGSNGAYSSEVDQLLSPSVNVGFAPIQTIGNETGNIYVMAKLVGSDADIAAVLSSSGAVGAADPQFAALHAAYDAQFGGGGFNALWRSVNYAGAKNISWNFSAHPNVTVDQLAAVPEPSMALLGLGAAAVLMRRRRGRVIA